MANKYGSWYSLIFLTSFILFIGLAHCNEIPYGFFEPSSWKAPSRSLLQQEETYLPCNISFDTMDYSVFGKGCGVNNSIDEHAPRKTCCAAWKLFVCPVRHYIKDMNTMCRFDMFWNIFHQYPMDDDYFTRFCREPGKNALDCLSVDEFRKHKGKNPIYDPLGIYDKGDPDADDAPPEEEAAAAAAPGEAPASSTPEEQTPEAAASPVAS